MARILIIDDDPLICELLTAAIEDQGYGADSAYSAAEGRSKMTSGQYDVVYLDVRLPDGDGLEVLAGIKQLPSPPEVIIITGRGDPDGAELATRNGAWDYIEKPNSLERMLLPLDRALRYRQAKATSAQPPMRRDNIAGSSAILTKTLDEAHRASGSSAEVLINGETGTGKELIARAIHDNSSRMDKPFVVVDCAALPDNLVESLLFGHIKGAFTGASTNRTGLVAEADGGTLFLDEVGELPLLVQAKFLRVLQERRFRPVGTTQEQFSDFRVVAATNRDLFAMAAAGQFRSDLLFRLKTLQIGIPPLRQRMEDVPELTQHVLRRLASRYETAIKTTTADLHEALCSYHWPGNIRELASAIETAYLAAQDEPALCPHHLPIELRATIARENVHAEPSAEPSLNDAPLLPWKEHRKQELKVIERKYFQSLMNHCHNDKKKACTLCGLKPARLYELLSKHGIKEF